MSFYETVLIKNTFEDIIHSFCEYS